MNINIDELIEQLKKFQQLQALLGSGVVREEPDLLAHLIGKKVVVRDNGAGVFVTTLEAVRGKQWRGGESRKIHYWSKAGALEGVAQTAIDFQNSRVTVRTPESNGQDLIQICPISDEIHKELMEAPVWNPK